MEVDDSEKQNRKRGIKDKPESAEAKKLCREKDDQNKGENNIEAYDSINLDLRDNELLNEETENTAKAKRDIRTSELQQGDVKHTAPSERPALLQLITGTDVDEAANEDSAKTASDRTAEDTAAATDSTPANDQQVNSKAPVTSSDGQKTGKDKGENPDHTDDKKDESKEVGARNLWVSGLSGDTRAKDLKNLCSKHGKVIGAKVVTTARAPGSRNYGYITMASAQDADNCIANLHGTELHGRVVSIEKAKYDSNHGQPSQPERRSSKDRKENGEDNEDGREDENSGEPKQKKDNEHRSTSHSREKSHRSDKERRRRAGEETLRARERQQRHEAQRLARERQLLRAEREKIEKEKNELLRLERERHKLEREKLELEKLELKRAQLRLEEERSGRGYEGGAAQRAPAPSAPEPYHRDQRNKRAPPPHTSSSRGPYQAPPPRYEPTASYDRGADRRDRDYKRDYDRDYKRDYPRHASSSSVKYPSNGHSNGDMRQPIPPGTRPKEPGSYLPRDRPYRPSPPGSLAWSTSNRYPEAAVPPKAGSGGVNGGQAWTGAAPRYWGYPPAHLPVPTATYPVRYAPPARDYRQY